MPLLPATTLTAAILGLILLILSIRVSQLRLSDRIGDGDGGHAGLVTRMRTQANFVEYVPLSLILLGLVERAHGLRLLLEIAAALLVVARIMHPIGMARPAPNPFRAGGALLTWIVLGWLSVWALLIAVRMWSVIG